MADMPLLLSHPEPGQPWARQARRTLLAASILLGSLTFPTRLTHAAAACVVVRPILVRGAQAETAVPGGLAWLPTEASWAPARVQFQPVDAVTYDDAAANDGTKDPDAVIAGARTAGALQGEGHVLNLLLVCRIRAQPVTRHRVWPETGVMLLATGTSPNAETAAADFQAAARELLAAQLTGETLVSRGTSNRTAELARPWVWCLPTDLARSAIVSESFEPYFSRLRRMEMAALTGVPATAGSLDACRSNVRSQFQRDVRRFSAEETNALTGLVARLQERFGADYPLLGRHPWRFIKVRNEHCSGFCYTRGLEVVLPEVRVEQARRAMADGDLRAMVRDIGGLIAHEQMHVWQRFYPERFAALYRQLGFRQAPVQGHAWLDERQMSNPDALRLDWVFPLGREGSSEAIYWMRTLLKEGNAVPRMGWDFWPVAVALVPAGDGYAVRTHGSSPPVIRAMAEVTEYTERFPAGCREDHPNEIAAAMFARLLADDLPRDDRWDAGRASDRTAILFRRWCRENLNAAP